MPGFATLDTVLNQNDYNSNLSKLQLHNQLQHGKGVLSGNELSDGGGLDLDISAGKLLAGAVEDLAGTTVTLAANSDLFIFRNASGGVTPSAVADDPGGTMVCLGYVETDADSITLITEAGRMWLPQMAEARVWKVGGGVVVVDSDQKLGFFGATPIEQPTIDAPNPATPAAPAMPASYSHSTVTLTSPGDMSAAYVEAEAQALRDDLSALQSQQDDIGTELEATQTALNDAIADLTAAQTTIADLHAKFGDMVAQLQSLGLSA